LNDKDWSIEKSVSKINSLTAIAKPAIENIVIEFWIAHEMIVNRKVEGWTWGRFCKETGYSVRTPYTWFEKFDLPWTKTGGMSFKKLKEDKPLKKLTKPETKFKLEEVRKKEKTEKHQQ